MKSSKIHLQWKGDSPSGRFRTGVSIHSHTLHSRESLIFVYNALTAVPFAAGAMRRKEENYRSIHGTSLDLTRGWWTPPLGPHDAWLVEKGQIDELDLDALISLTDHDDIEAPVSLQILEECRDIPISFEWTVPFGPTFFHLGVHNLPSSKARRMYEELNAYSLQPRPESLPELMTSISSLPGTLIVFNHPLWDEKQIGQDAHVQAVQDFVRLYGAHIHALEMNGLRPWRENRRVFDFASAVHKPVVSGGDRHGLEPNANLNLTNSTSFAEFADEVRSGWSDILIMQQYRESHVMRIVHNVIDILATHERHAYGWKLWSDRVFYLGDDGQTRSLTELMGERPPAFATVFGGVVNLASHPGIRRLLHEAFLTGEGVVL